MPFPLPGHLPGPMAVLESTCCLCETTTITMGDVRIRRIMVSRPDKPGFYEAHVCMDCARYDTYRGLQERAAAKLRQVEETGDTLISQTAARDG